VGYAADIPAHAAGLILAAVDAWERATGTSRLELAEKSRIWRVNIEDGRLRARVTQRYLALSKLPANPRWRDVVRTAYFVPGHCNMEAEGVRRSRAGSMRFWCTPGAARGSDPRSGRFQRAQDAKPLHVSPFEAGGGSALVAGFRV
jgi:hypothetical protein